MAIEKIQKRDVVQTDLSRSEAVSSSPSATVDASIKQPVSKGWELFPDTMGSTPPVETAKAAANQAGIYDWILSFFSSEPKKPTAKVEKNAVPALPSRPKLAPPSNEARNMVERLNAAMREANRSIKTAQEDLRELPEGHIYKKMVSLFKRVISQNEELLKNSAQDNRARSEMLQRLNDAKAELREQLHSVEFKESIAKTTQTGLSILSIATVAFVVGGAAFATATGFVPALLPAISQATASSGFIAAQTALTAARATTQGTRLYLENKRDKNQSEGLQKRHERDELFFEFKLSRQDWVEFTKMIDDLWGTLKEIDEKRREAIKLEA